MVVLCVFFGGERRREKNHLPDLFFLAGGCASGVDALAPADLGLLTLGGGDALILVDLDLGQSCPNLVRFFEKKKITRLDVCAEKRQLFLKKIITRVDARAPPQKRSGIGF